MAPWTRKKRYDPDKEVENVCDAKSFLNFLEILREDLPSKESVEDTPAFERWHSGVGGWMNQDLWSFLEAAHAGGEIMGFGEDADTAEKAWKAAARILLIGKHYE